MDLLNLFEKGLGDISNEDEKQIHSAKYLASKIVCNGKLLTVKDHIKTFTGMFEPDY